MELCADGRLTAIDLLPHQSSQSMDQLDHPLRFLAIGSRRRRTRDQHDRRLFVWAGRSREPVSSADRDLLNMDRAAVWAEIAQRNALRKLAQLPLLDEQREFDNACQTILSARWRAFRATKQADYERIHDEVVAERGHPSGSIGGWGIRMEIGKWFEAFLRAHYSDEIAIVTQIAPDYLAITKQVTEGRKNAD